MDILESVFAVFRVIHISTRLDPKNKILKCLKILKIPVSRKPHVARLSAILRVSEHANRVSEHANRVSEHADRVLEHAKICVRTCKIRKLSTCLDSNCFLRDNLMTYKDFNKSKTVLDKEDIHKKITTSSRSSVQPAILLRLGVFLPSNRSRKTKAGLAVDVSNALSQLEFARTEGYDEVIIRGERLNITTDFRVWMGVIGVFGRYGLATYKVTVPFKEFASLCDYDSRQVNHKLRASVFDSLARLGTKVIQFKSKKTEKRFFTQLLKTAKMDDEGETITIEAEPRLWELYLIDYNILLRKQPYNELKGKEVAQALYTYLASLPDGFAPISFTRLMERLLLTSSPSEQNRLIKAALEAMAAIGYIQYSLVEKRGETHLQVHKRNKKLKDLQE